MIAPWASRGRDCLRRRRAKGRWSLRISRGKGELARVDGVSVVKVLEEVEEYGRVSRTGRVAE